MPTSEQRLCPDDCSEYPCTEYKSDRTLPRNDSANFTDDDTDIPETHSRSPSRSPSGSPSGSQSRSRSSVAPSNVAENDPDKEKQTDVLHRKCPVIKLVRKQIENLMDDKHKGSRGNINGCQIILCKIWKRRFSILAASIPFIIWLAAVSGAIMGASLCGGTNNMSFVRNPLGLY